MDDVRPSTDAPGASLAPGDPDGAATEAREQARRLLGDDAHAAPEIVEALAATLADPVAAGKTWRGTPVVTQTTLPQPGRMPAHLAKYAWKPGHKPTGLGARGNPSYRSLFRKKLRELAAARGSTEPGDEEMLIVEAHLSMILQGKSVDALKVWLDREHGPVVQKVEQNVSVQDITRREFEAFMTRTPELEAPEGEADESAPGSDDAEP